MNHEEIGKIVLEATSGRDDDRRILACAKAFAIAKKHDVGIGEIGTICNNLNIKIVTCQLGCFK